MASSETGICNSALIKLGADTIIDLTENNVRGRTMNVLYQPVRDAELHRRRWKFSIARAALPALSTAPISGYAYQYQLPVDYLRLVEGGDIVATADLTDYRGGDGAALYSIEGLKLLTHLGAPLDIRYIAKITDVGLFNPSFAEALASRLAYEGCERITQSDSKRQLAMNDYKLAIHEATRANAIEAPPQSMADDSWLVSRLG